MNVTTNQDSEPPNALQVVAIACHLNDIDGIHTGFLYDRDEAGSRWFCDVAWDRICRNIAVGREDLVWVNVNQDSMNLRFIVAALRKMDQNSGIIRYDVRFDDDLYFDLLTWKYNEEKPGLTCATFVLAILRNLGLELLDTKGWLLRDEDVAAFNSLIDRP